MMNDRKLLKVHVFHWGWIAKDHKSFTKGGVQTYLSNLAEVFREEGYEFNYYETTGDIKEAGGDGYLANITSLYKYSDAYQALDIIDAYVKNNGGTCERSEPEPVINE